MSSDNQQLVKNEMPIVRAAFEKMMPQFHMALPKHITPERMVRVALTAIQNTPKLLECNRQSLYSAVMRAAQLGLEPDGILGQAYLIPYGDQVQFIPGYKGLIDLARRSGDVSNILAKEVCENDDFDVDFSQEVPFKHKPKLDGDRGKVLHFWALARFKGGGFHWDYMTVVEVIAIRDQSSGWKAAVAWSKNPKNKKTAGKIISPWEQNFIEMGKKTVLRRIAKYLPMSVQKAAMVEDLVDAGKRFTTDELGDIVLTGEGGDVIENGEADAAGVTDQPKASKLDTFAGHDPETGEVLDQATDQATDPNQSAAPSDAPTEKRPAPKPIPMPSLPDDNTQPDIDAWAMEWEAAVASATDADWLKKLRKANETLLGSFAVRNRAKHAECVKFYDEMLAELTGGKAAA